MIRLQKPTVVESPGEDHAHARAYGKGERRRVPALLPPLHHDDPVLDARPDNEGHEDPIGKVQVDAEDVHQAQGPEGPHHQRREGGQDGDGTAQHDGEEKDDEDDRIDGGLDAGVAELFVNTDSVTGSPVASGSTEASCRTNLSRN